MRQHTVLAALALAACGAPFEGAAPESMSAYDHRSEGRKHERRADAVARKYDQRARATIPLPIGLAVVPDINADAPELATVETGYSVERYNPTERYRQMAKQHHQHAREHYAAALDLEGTTNQACRDISVDVRPICPLLSVVVGTEPVEDGVRFVLSRGADTEAVAAHMRCHQAYGVERHFASMGHCPLYLPKLRIEADPDTASVLVRADAHAVMQVLRSRAQRATEDAER